MRAHQAAWRVLRAIITVIIILHQAGSAAEDGQVVRRGLKQDFAQFTPVDSQQTFGGWGGRWVLTPTANAQPFSSPGAVQTGASAYRPTTLRSASGRSPTTTTIPTSSSNSGSSNGSGSGGRPFTTSSGSTARMGSAGSSGRGVGSSSMTTGGRESGVSVVNAGITVDNTRGFVVMSPAGLAASSNTAPSVSSTVGMQTGGAAATGTSSTAAAGPVGTSTVNVRVDAAATPAATAAAAAAAAAAGASVPAADDISGTIAALSKNAGVLNGRNPTLITNAAAVPYLPRFVPHNGTFVAGSDVGQWASQNPASRVDATFLDGDALSKAPPPDNITVVDPAPVQTVRLPAASFESGYCVPRQAFLVVNVTALACKPGSNLTRWDEEPVCARIDCGWRARGTNVLNSASGCRTVVERAKPICPSGCNVIEQLRWNSTVNRTQLFTKCSCKAGNQPCPNGWTGCICYEGLSSRNLTRGFVVCSETQGECDRKCNLAVSGNPRLAPLCPIAMDPFLSINATGPPIYPLFGWNMGAAMGGAGRRLKQLAGFGRSLRMQATADLRLFTAAPDVAKVHAETVARGRSKAATGSRIGTPLQQRLAWQWVMWQRLMWRRLREHYQTLKQHHRYEGAAAA